VICECSNNNQKEQGIMKTNILLAMAGVGLAFVLGATQVEAQGGGGGGFGRGNFDPQQIRQNMLDNVRDQLSVTNDDEWKVIGDQVQKVMDAQLQLSASGSLNMFRLFRRNNNNNGQGGGNGGGAATTGGGAGNGGGRRAGGMAAFLGADASDPEGEALQAALDRNAPPAEIKAAIAKVMTARKQKQDKLDQARSGLRDLLTPKQEGTCVTLGLL
jgi:hypothetical protein